MNRFPSQTPEALLSHVEAALACTVHGDDGRILPGIELTLRSMDGREHVAIVGVTEAAALSRALLGAIADAVDLARKKREAN